MVCWHSRADQVNEPVVATGRSPPHLSSKHEPDRLRRMRHPVSIYVEDIGLQDRAPAILKTGIRAHCDGRVTGAPCVTHQLVDRVVGEKSCRCGLAP